MVITALTPELATARVQTWLEDRHGDGLVVSEWVVTEVSSALAFKLRAGSLDVVQRDAALGVFGRMIDGMLGVLPVASPHFRAAARYTDRYDLGLRAPDALHLAVCADNGATLVTLDRRLLAAAPHLGISAEAP